MNREEVLRKSKKDMWKEEYRQVRYSGQELGAVVFTCLAGFLIILDFFMGKISYEVQGLFFAFFASLCYSKYRTYQTKTYLVLLIASALGSIVFIGLYIMNLYKINF